MKPEAALGCVDLTPAGPVAARQSHPEEENAQHQSPWHPSHRLPLRCPRRDAGHSWIPSQDLEHRVHRDLVADLRPPHAPHQDEGHAPVPSLLVVAQRVDDLSRVDAAEPRREVRPPGATRPGAPPRHRPPSRAAPRDVRRPPSRWPRPPRASSGGSPTAPRARGRPCGRSSAPCGGRSPRARRARRSGPSRHSRSPPRLRAGSRPVAGARPRPPRARGTAPRPARPRSSRSRRGPSGIRARASVRSVSGSISTSRGWWKAPMRFLPRGWLTATLPADGSVDLREEGRRHLDHRQAAHERRPREAGQVAHDAAADRDDRGVAVEAVGHEPVPQPLGLAEALALLALRHDEDCGLESGARGGSPSRASRAARRRAA